MIPILPYLLLAAGYGVARHSDKRTQERQKKLIDAMEQFQTKKARGSEASIDKYLSSISPVARAAEGEQARGELQRELEQSVGAAQAFEQREPYAGRVSSDVAGRRDSNEALIKAKIEKAIGELATIGTPREQGLRQQTRFGHAAGDVDAANASIRNVGNAYDATISRVRPSFGETLLSQLLIGMGTAGVGGAASAGTAAAGAGSLYESPRRRGTPRGYRPTDRGTGLL